jgi:hypothetical protein
MGFPILRTSSRKLPENERRLSSGTRIHSTFDVIPRGPLLAQGRGMQESPPVDGNVFVWSLSILVIALIVAAMLYAVGIGLENITRIGV